MSDKRIDPQGWVKINVETASSEIISGSGFPKEYQGESTGDYPFAKVGDISRVFRSKQKCISSAGHFISEKIRNKIKARVFPKGAIVFPKIGEALKGNYRVVTNREMLFDNNVMGIIPDTKLISGDFFYYFLTTQDFGRYAVATAVPSVRRGDIASISISLPPLSEQHRIVAKIDELFSELDKGIENLKTARAQLKVYRQALLKHAFEGKLTARWRAERNVISAKAGIQPFNDMDSRLRGNDEPLETADALLKRIQQERTQRHQQQLADWEAAGKQSSKPKAPKPLPQLTAEEQAELPRLPDGWGWTRLGNTNVDVSDGPFGSNLKSSDYVDSGVRVVRLENIGTLKFFEEKESYITEEKYELRGCLGFCVNGVSSNSVKSVLQTEWKSGSVRLSSPGLALSISC